GTSCNSTNFNLRTTPVFGCL
ncbi:hypothetical protein M514_01526, partial [Trichuris suis]